MIQHRNSRRFWRLLSAGAFGLLGMFAVPAASYSVLTHEAIVDSTWDSAIKPLLLKRFPASTADELTQAHAYAYGGCIIQDLGYYPFGSKFFSDLTHYVRSGDFILNLIRESQDLNEYPSRWARYRISRPTTMATGRRRTCRYRCSTRSCA